MNPKDLVGAKKAPLTLVPPTAIIAIAEAMGNGAEKYGPFNWRDQPVQVRTYVEAAQRHLLAFLDGQWAAEDTGISQIATSVARAPHLRPTSNASVRVSLSSAAFADDMPPPYPGMTRSLAMYVSD